MPSIGLEWLEKAHARLVASGKPFRSADVAGIARQMEKRSWMPWDVEWLEGRHRA